MHTSLSRRGLIGRSAALSLGVVSLAVAAGSPWAPHAAAQEGTPMPVSDGQPGAADLNPQPLPPSPDWGRRCRPARSPGRSSPPPTRRWSRATRSSGPGRWSTSTTAAWPSQP